MTTSCWLVHPSKGSSVVIERKYNECRENTTSRKLILKDIFKDEVQVPPNVSLFFEYLIAGRDSRRWKQTIRQKRISSISADTVYAATSGLKKTQKHLTIGLALNSL